MCIIFMYENTLYNTVLCAMNTCSELLKPVSQKEHKDQVDWITGQSSRYCVWLRVRSLRASLRTQNRQNSLQIPYTALRSLRRVMAEQLSPALGGPDPSCPKLPRCVSQHLRVSSQLHSIKIFSKCFMHLKLDIQSLYHGSPNMFCSLKMLNNYFMCIGVLSTCMPVQCMPSAHRNQRALDLLDLEL